MTREDWFDAYTWVHQHLSDPLPGWLVLPEHDANDRTRFPCLIWALTLTPGDEPGIWLGHLTLVCDMPTSDAPRLMAEVTRVVSGWRPPGPACDVDLVSVVPDRASREDLSRLVATYWVEWSSVHTATEITRKKG